MSDLLRDDQISIDCIESLAKQAFISSDRDDDGDLFLREGGIKTYVRVDNDRKLITFFTVWGFKSRFTLQEKLEFVNSLNDGKILVRFVVARPDTFWCDYMLLYEGGITPFNIINTYKRFVSICKGALDKDERNMIGND